MCTTKNIGFDTSDTRFLLTILNQTSLAIWHKWLNKKLFICKLNTNTALKWQHMTCHTKKKANKYMDQHGVHTFESTTQNQQIAKLILSSIVVDFSWNSWNLTFIEYNCIDTMIRKLSTWKVERKEYCFSFFYFRQIEMFGSIVGNVKITG